MCLLKRHSNWNGCLTKLKIEKANLVHCGCLYRECTVYVQMQMRINSYALQLFLCPLCPHLSTFLSFDGGGVGRSEGACAECATLRFAALSLGRHLRFPLLCRQIWRKQNALQAVWRYICGCCLGGVCNLPLTFDFNPDMVEKKLALGD